MCAKWNLITDLSLKPKAPISVKDVVRLANLEDKKKALTRCVDILVFAHDKARDKRFRLAATAAPKLVSSIVAPTPGKQGKSVKPGISSKPEGGQVDGPAAPIMADFYTPEETTILTNAIIAQTEFLKFAPDPLMRRLVQFLRLKRVEPQECILKRGELLSDFMFLLQGHIGVYCDTPAAKKGTGGDKDEYGDAMSDSTMRVRVLTPLAVIEEEKALFGAETKFAYAGVRTPPGQVGLSVSAQVPVSSPPIICGYLLMHESEVQDILATVVDSYSGRMLFVHKHFPSAHRYSDDTRTLLANSCTEEKFSHKSSLAQLMDRVHAKAVLALLSSGVVVCGPFEHPNMELQPGAIIGVQSQMSTRGGVWAKCPVTVLTWSWSQVLSAEAKAKADEARALAASIGVHTKTPPSVAKKASPPSITQIIATFSIDHLRSVGGDTLQARLNRFEAANAKPSKSTVSHARAPAKWCKLQKLLDRSDGLKSTIRSELVLPVSRSPPKQSDKLLLGPRSFALKNAEALSKKKRFSSTPALAIAQRPMTSEGKIDRELCGEAGPIMEIPTPRSRPQTANPLLKMRTMERPHTAISRRSKPNERPYSGQ